MRTHGGRQAVFAPAKNRLTRRGRFASFSARQPHHGAIAQLVERLNGIQKVRSSTLLSSTRVHGTLENPSAATRTGPAHRAGLSASEGRKQSPTNRGVARMKGRGWRACRLGCPTLSKGQRESATSPFSVSFPLRFSEGRSAHPSTERPVFKGFARIAQNKSGISRRKREPDGSGLFIGADLPVRPTERRQSVP